MAVKIIKAVRCKNEANRIAYGTVFTFFIIIWWRKKALLCYTFLIHNKILIDDRKYTYNK